MKRVTGKSRIKRNESFEGLTLMQELEKITLENGMFETTKEVVYTDRADGVLPEFNIRTDKQEEFISLMDKVREIKKQRIEKLKEYEKKLEA